MLRSESPHNEQIKIEEAKENMATFLHALSKDQITADFGEAFLSISEFITQDLRTSPQVAQTCQSLRSWLTESWQNRRFDPQKDSDEFYAPFLFELTHSQYLLDTINKKRVEEEPYQVSFFYGVPSTEGTISIHVDWVKEGKNQPPTIRASVLTEGISTEEEGKINSRFNQIYPVRD